MSMLPPTSSTTSNYSPFPDVRMQENPPPSDSNLVQERPHEVGEFQQGFQAFEMLPPSTSSSLTLMGRRESDGKEKEKEKNPEKPYSSLRTVDVQDPNSEENMRCRIAAGMTKPSSVLSDSVNFFAQFPGEIVYEMFSKFDPDSLLNMLMVDSRFHNLIKTSPILYKEFLVGQAVKKMLKCVDQIQYAQNKNRALCLIALLQSLTNPKEAIKIANDIPHEMEKFCAPCESLKRGVDKPGVICMIIEKVAKTSLEQALSIAEDIEDRHIKDWALYRILQVQPSTNLEQMKDISRTIQHKSLKDYALFEIIKKHASANPKEALCLIGDLQNNDHLEVLIHIIFKKLLKVDPNEAISTAHDVEDEFLKNLALSAIAKIQASTDLDQALRTVEGIKDAKIQDWTLFDIVEVQRAINPEQALVIAKCIQDKDYKDTALGDFVKALASTHPELALSAAKDIQNAQNKGSALWIFATILASNVPEQAFSIAEQALLNAKDVQDDYFRGRIFREIYKIIASANLEKALEMAEREDDHGRDIALGIIVEVQALADSIQALATVRVIRNKTIQLTAFKEIVKVQASISKEQALNTVDEAISSINPNWRRDLFHSSMSKGMARTNPMEAIKLAISIRDDKAFEEVVKAQAAMNPALVLAAADHHIWTDKVRDDACRIIAGAYPNDHSAALVFAGDIKDPDLRVKFLFEFSKKLTDPQQTHEVLLQALNSASPIENPVRQIRLLHDIVQAMVNTM